MLEARRLCAVVATVAAAGGAVGLGVAVADAEPFRYVSESGVQGAPHAGLYRISMLLLAGSLALLVVPARLTGRLAVEGFGEAGGWGFGRVLRPVLPAGLVAWALGVAAPLAGVASAVTCSPGCPLPPYESTTPRDLTHAAGAIGALMLCALVMLLYAVQPDPGPLRRAGRFGVVVAFPALVLSAVGILLLGRGLFTGVAERGALVAVSGWLVLTAALHVRAKP